MVRAERAEGLMASLDAPMHQAAQRARGYWFLSRLFLEVPTATMLAELRQMSPDRADGVESIELTALRDAVAAAQADPDVAGIAFTRHLSLGDRNSREPLPFEAHVREGCLPGESTQQVAAAMHEAGYDDVAPTASSPDHLGAELRFMALLCHREYEAWGKGDRSGAGDALRRQRNFLSLHLAKWAPDYCRDLMSRTSNAYLRSLAALAASSIDGDVAALDDICRWLAPEELAPVSVDKSAAS